MSVKITSFEISDVKRIRAVSVDVSGKALTVIGGKNGQGKTSVLDALVYALGGERYRPTNLERDGADNSPAIRIELSNGLVVERSGKNSALKVVDPSGAKGGQQLLNEFVSAFSIDLPKFLNASDAEKARMLLQIIGIEGELKELEEREKSLYSKRHTHGQIADQKKKTARELPHYPQAPEDIVSVSELISRQQEILKRNAENASKRNNIERLKMNADSAKQDVERKKQTLEDLKKQVMQLEAAIEEAEERCGTIAFEVYNAEQEAKALVDESTSEIEMQIRNAESINEMVRANKAQQKAQTESNQMEVEREKMTADIEAVRAKRLALLEGAKMPLDGLSVEDSKLTYNGKFWDCMSGAEQLRIGTAIARSLNKQCGFVLVDKAEQFDIDTLKDFGNWLESEGLQAIATRVSTGDECSIIIEDGEVVL